MCSTALCAARASLVALAAGTLLASCTYFEKRVVREFSGVMLHADDEQPIEGALVVLYEHRHRRIPFPGAFDLEVPIAHALTNGNGQFHFRVCMTERPYYLGWDRGQSGRAAEWLVDEPRNVEVRLFTKPTDDTSMSDFTRIKRALENEDTSFTESCM